MEQRHQRGQRPGRRRKAWLIVLAVLGAFVLLAAIGGIMEATKDGEQPGPKVTKTATATETEPKTSSPKAPAPRATETVTETAPGSEPEETNPDPKASYKNCAEVREAGKDPLHPGDPGYSEDLDANRDGVACER
jgi:hypothetical protein